MYTRSFYLSFCATTPFLFLFNKLKYVLNDTKVCLLKHKQRFLQNVQISLLFSCKNVWEDVQVSKRTIYTIYKKRIAWWIKNKRTDNADALWLYATHVCRSFIFDFTDLILIRINSKRRSSLHAWLCTHFRLHSKPLTCYKYRVLN